MTDVTYLVPGTGLDAEECDRRERVANDLVTADVRVVASDHGPTTIESTVEEAWSVVGAMQKAHEIEGETDAIVIGCFGDPGLRAIRELVDVPVVAPAEATLHTAAQVADRFGWLTILDETVPLAREQVHEHGFDHQCATIRSVGVPVESVDHASDELPDRMIEVGHRAVEEDGAEVLFPGCMSISFAQQHDAIQSALGVPFLDPATIALEQAASWARHGIVQSPETYPEPKLEKLDGLLGTTVPPESD